MKTYLDWANKLDNIKKFQGSTGSRFVKEQLTAWYNCENVIVNKINDYVIIDVMKLYDDSSGFYDEFLIIRNDYKIYKSFERLDLAIDYCLDKINNESKQINLEL